ncbi:DNA polymerase III subunit gamma/tau [Litorivivens sp.]|uniref:DNA polymerase III subunit gamma/tau n=1 Tax=Litorivivens sp. TaxID=2020868 RepID=UPI003566E90C
MSYQVLARKWRPRSFREMAGQAHVLKALVNALDHDRLHHAYLFTGTRGVGKTTIARILAKCLNCESGVSSEPCGTCDACVSINEGRFVDLIEVDAASKTKVDDTRELLDNVQYTPTRGRYKVYLIDEVHMLSGHSFNALLKTLEEPPPHVKFLLATTDPQKIPATILSRCLQFSLKNMSPEKIVEHLTHILGQEMIGFEEPALWQLARAAEGSMRDALSLTDQAIAFGGGKLGSADVEAMLGTIDHSAIKDIASALNAGDAQGLLQTVSRLADQGVDFAGVLADLLSFLHRVAIAQAVPEAVDGTLPDSDAVKTLAAELPAEDVQYFYQVGLAGRRDLPLAPDARSGLEMVLLRMIAFRPAGVHQLPQASAGSAPPVKKPSAPTGAKTVENSQRTGSHVLKAPVPPSAHSEAPRRTDTAPASAPVQSSAPPVVVAQAVDAEVTMPEAPVATGTTILFDDLTPTVWREQFDAFGLAGLLRSICSHCILQQVGGDRLCFQIAPENAHLLNDAHHERFEKALSSYFERPLRIEIEQIAITQETPAEYQQRKEAEHQEYLKNLIHADPNVQLLVQEFQAVVDDNSIRPGSGQ